MKYNKGEMIRKLWVVYNPRSSHHAAVEAEILAPARAVSGFLVGKYEIKRTSVEHNVSTLAGMLGDGDLVVSAGGDGTATIAANAVMKSKKDVTFSAIGYGNFNDMARMLKTRRPVEYGGEYVGGLDEIVKRFVASSVEDVETVEEAGGPDADEVGDVDEGSGRGAVVGHGSASSVGIREIYPLEILVDGEHWRYAPCYATLGLLAEATELMDGDRVRKSLNTGKRGALYSLFVAVFWYLKNRKRNFLPATGSSVDSGENAAGSEDVDGENATVEGVSGDARASGNVVVKVNGEAVPEGTTDYLAVNGPTLAKLMKGGKWYLEEGKFGSVVRGLGKFWKMVGFGLKSVIFRVPLKETEGDVIEFDRPSDVEIQAEGEYQKLKGVSKIEVRKAERGMKVIFGDGR